MSGFSVRSSASSLERPSIGRLQAGGGVVDRGRPAHGLDCRGRTADAVCGSRNASSAFFTSARFTLAAGRSRSRGLKVAVDVAEGAQRVFWALGVEMLGAATDRPSPATVNFFTSSASAFAFACASAWARSACRSTPIAILPALRLGGGARGLDGDLALGAERLLVALAVLELQLDDEVISPVCDMRMPRPVPSSNWVTSRLPGGILSFFRKASEKRKPRGRTAGSARRLLARAAAGTVVILAGHGLQFLLVRGSRLAWLVRG